MNANLNDESKPVSSVRSDRDKQAASPPGPREDPHALANFVRRAPVALAMFDHQMCYVAVSRPWAMNFNVGDRELVGQSHYDVFPNLPQRWREAHQQALKGDSLSVAEAPWHHSDGTISWHHWELSPWRDECGTIGGVILFIENVSTPKAINEVLRLLSVESAGMEFSAFAQHATRRIGQILEVDMVQLSVPCPDAPGWAETIAVFNEGEPATNYRYRLAGSPCDEALQRRICIYPEAVCKEFPDDAELGADLCFVRQFRKCAPRCENLLFFGNPSCFQNLPDRLFSTGKAFIGAMTARPCHPVHANHMRLVLPGEHGSMPADLLAHW